MTKALLGLLLSRPLYSASFRVISPRPRVFVPFFRMHSSLDNAAPKHEVVLDSTALDDLDIKSHGEEEAYNPLRTVICADAIEWLNAVEDNGLPEGYCGFTSLPDLSEVQNLFKQDTDAYKKWFTDSAALFMSKLSVGSYVVFLQSDIRYMSETREVCEWVDKSYLCSVAAESTGCTLMWHKLVYTDKGNSKRSTGRPSYSHLLCYSKSAVGAVLPRSKNKQRKDHHQHVKARKADMVSTTTRSTADSAETEESNVPQITQDDGNHSTTSCDADKQDVDDEAGTEAGTVTELNSDSSPGPPIRCTYRTALFAVPDIFFRGEMLWPKGIGLDCCFVGVQFLKSVANARGIIDPFAGQGTVLAMANAVGLPAIGVEISAKRCRKTRNLPNIDLELISPYLRKISMDLVEERAEMAQLAVHNPRKGKKFVDDEA